MHQKVLILGAIVVLLFLIASCTTAAKAAAISVTADEWSLKLDSRSLQADQVALDVVNQGQATHEMVVLRTDLATDALKLKANGAEVDESASGQTVGEVEDIGPGQTKTVTLNLAPGHYVLVCNLPGHYRAGMVTEFFATP